MTTREFADDRGRRWRVAYSSGGEVKGLISMRQIVFRPLEAGDGAGERYLAVHPGYLESVDDHQLRIALRQAQAVDPPW